MLLPFGRGAAFICSKLLSVYGEIKTAWRCEDGKISVDVTVPAGTAALLTLPEKKETISLGSGSNHYEYETETRLEQERYTLEIPLRVMLWLMLIRISKEALFRRDSQKPRWKRVAYTSMRFFLGVFLFFIVTFRFVLIALRGRFKIKTAVSTVVSYRPDFFFFSAFAAPGSLFQFL